MRATGAHVAEPLRFCYQHTLFRSAPTIVCIIACIASEALQNQLGSHCIYLFMFLFLSRAKRLWLRFNQNLLPTLHTLIPRNVQVNCTTTALLRLFEIEPTVAGCKTTPLQSRPCVLGGALRNVYLEQENMHRTRAKQDTGLQMSHQANHSVKITSISDYRLHHLRSQNECRLRPGNGYRVEKLFPTNYLPLWRKRCDRFKAIERTIISK